MQKKFVMTQDEVNMFLLSLKELTTYGTYIYYIFCLALIIAGNIMFRHIRYGTLRPYTGFIMSSIAAFAIFILSIEANIVQQGWSLSGLAAHALMVGFFSDVIGRVVFEKSQDKNFVQKIILRKFGLSEERKVEVKDEKKA